MRQSTFWKASLAKGEPMSSAKKRAVTAAKDFMAMDAKQLAEATAEFNQECAVDKSRPLTDEEERQWENAKRKRGRPTVGKGVKVISVSLERDLLARATRLAEKLGISRAQLIARGLQGLLAEIGEK